MIHNVMTERECDLIQVCEDFTSKGM